MAPPPVVCFNSNDANAIRTRSLSISAQRSRRSAPIDQYGQRSRVLIVLPLSAAVVAALLVSIELSFRIMKRSDVNRQFALALSFVLALFAAKQASRVAVPCTRRHSRSPSDS